MSAAWNTNIAAAQLGGTNALGVLNDPNFSMGRLAAITATYTMTGNEAANDTIYIARVPQGALIDPSVGSIATGGGAAAATLTMSVGDTDTQGGTVSYDPARYSAAIDVHAQTTTTAVPFSNGTTLTAPTETTDDWVWLLATFTTLVTPSANKTLVFRIKAAALD